MNFLAPGAFLFGLLLPVIVALYLLKLRRVEHDVASTYLWRKMVRDVEANAPWQRLHPNLLMILQLLFLLALIFALARPFSWAQGVSGQAAIFILDTSASMTASDVQPSRLESAKERARQLIDDLPDNARATVIAAGREARVLLSSSLDRRQAFLAVQGLQPETGGSDMNVALELASAIAARQPGTEIVVLSDGRVELPQRLVLKGRLRYIPFGLSGENQAISLLTLEPTPGSDTMTAFIQVANYGEQTVTRRVLLEADGVQVNAFDVSGIVPGSSKSVIDDTLPGDTRVIRASLDGTDTLALDDVALAVRPDTRPVPVTLVSPGNIFLSTALSLMPGVILTEQQVALPPAAAATPDAATPTPLPTNTAVPAGQNQSAALTIYDGTVPEVLPASGSLLFIAPPRSTELFSTTGLVNDPELRVVDPSDPLLVNLALDLVSLREAITIPLPAWATPVLSGQLSDGSGNTPLLFRGEVNGRRIVVIPFDLHPSNTDLPLQIAYPLLWFNIVDWLAPGAGSAVPAQVEPGATLSFAAPEGKTSATIVRPDNQSISLQAQNGRLIFTDTTQLGQYQVLLPESEGSPARQAAFTVNLFAPSESNLKPADFLPGLETQTGTGGSGNQLGMREWWRPLALLAVGLLTGEWLVYQRAALARIKDILARRKPPVRRIRGRGTL